MLVDPRDLETSPDRGGRIEEHHRTIAVLGSGQRRDGVQPGAVQEREQREIEVHIALGCQVEESFREKRRCSEIELSGQAHTRYAGEGRNLEHRHGGLLLPELRYTKGRLVKYDIDVIYVKS